MFHLQGIEAAMKEPRIIASQDKRWRAAVDRVGRTYLDLAKWMLEFAYRELKDQAMSDQAWDSLISEANAFFAVQNALKNQGTDTLAEKYPEPFDVKSIPGGKENFLAIVHNEIRNVVMNLSEEGEFKIIHITHYLAKFENGRLKTAQEIEEEEGIPAIVWRVLDKAKKHCRRCSECGRVFIGVKRQLYCSRRCSQTVRTRKYRHEHAEKFRASRREAYKRKAWKDIL